ERHHLAPDPHHGAQHPVGRPPGPVARARPGGRGDHRRGQAPAEARPRAHGVRAGGGPPLAHPPDRPGRGDRHRGGHPPGGRLGHHDAAAGPREQRHRDDERARGVRRPRLVRPQGRLQVHGPLLRLRAGRPGLLHRGDGPPAPGAHGHRARRGGGRGGGPRLQGPQPGHHRHRPALRQRARARGAHVAHAAVQPARGADDPRLRPAHAVPPRGRHLGGARARGPPRPRRDLQRRGRRRPGPERDPRPPGQDDPPRPAAVRDGRGDVRPAPARAADPGRHAGLPALRPRPGQPQAQGHGLPLPLHDARDRPQAPRAPAPGAAHRRRGGRLPLRAGGRGVPAPLAERAPRGDRPGRAPELPAARRAGQARRGAARRGPGRHVAAGQRGAVGHAGGRGGPPAPAGLRRPAPGARARLRRAHRGRGGRAAGLARARPARRPARARGRRRGPQGRPAGDRPPAGARPGAL
ncbi:MAG: hypothetical protein AVDCRST_MAG13-123, partial [uncultured Solirubrobacteraceae bacterium]